MPGQLSIDSRLISQITTVTITDQDLAEFVKSKLLLSSVFIIVMKVIMDHRV